MTNLADLLPAGGGQNNTEFVADGNISAGAPVILTAAGKAAPVSGSPTTIGTPTDILYQVMNVPIVSEITGTNKTYAGLSDYNGGSNKGTGFILSASGNAITVGAGADYTSVEPYYPINCYDSVNSRIVQCWQETGSPRFLKVCVGSVSGTTITWGTPVNVKQWSTGTFMFYARMAFDPDTGNFCIVYRDGTNSNYLTSFCGTVQSGTVTATMGVSPTVINSALSDYSQLCYDTTQDRFIIIYDQGTTNFYARAATCTGSGSSATLTGSIGSAAEIGSSESISQWPLVVHDSTAGKNVIAYIGAGNTLKAATATIDPSTNAITVGAVTTISGAVVTADSLGLAYDPTANKTLLVYRDNGSPYYSYYVELTVSGSDITASSPAVFYSQNSQYKGLAYNATEQEIVVVIGDASVDYNKGLVFVFESSNLTSTNLLGLAPEAISDTATGTINTWGSRCESASLSLAAALRFGTSAVFESANAGVITETFDSTNNKVVVAYKDSGNSNYGTAAVGTVSGSSISFGTPAVFESAEVGELSAAFDSNENRVVISYRDAGNSNYGTAVVGEVSGTSISFGTPATFSGTNSAYNTSTAFDSSNNKIVVSYRDTSNSNYGTAAVGTVSGASITFGTPVVYSAAATTNYGSITYDSTSNQIVLCYQSGVDEKAIVGAVSGTSISFGAEATVESSASPGHRSVAFDSTNNRVVDTYSNGSTGYCTSAIGTVSGTSISFGTPVIADTASTGYLGSAFDVSSGKIVIVYNASASGLANTGTVSGTTITFGDKVTFLSGDPNHVGAVYDSNANRVVVSYSDATNSNYGTSITASSGTVPLTVATDYYVQTDGTLSTDTGGQLIGKTITTTQINIKDYTG